ncbi:aminodeoxychorismate synthase component 1 [Abditibacteriota bacterium]|nr:aminodeoxychorismate synthase component 1 [Abditibacteriota bacterium]
MLCGYPPLVDFGRQILDFNGTRIEGASPYAVCESFAELRPMLNEGARRFPRGGAIGFWSYEAARVWEPRFWVRQRTDDWELPPFRLVFFGELKRETSPPSQLESPLLRSVPDDEKTRHFYTSGVERIKEYIAAGDIYQANLTHRFELESSYSPRHIYEQLRALGPAPRGALLEWSDFAVVSNSPETFLSFHERVLESKPIKGTIARGSTPEEDKQLQAQLSHSAKDRAENVMIVDLLRNDLGRVCEFGSVHVPALCEIETFPTLHHLVSTVRGTLRHDLEPLDAFCAAFPCGSISGAPKMRAMQILSELEPVTRGVSMGAIGYFGFDGTMEWSVAIRTATLKDGVARFHAGGGIVADSVPELELQEMQLKARALWSCLG